MISDFQPGDVAFKARLLREVSEIKSDIAVLRSEMESVKVAASNSHSRDVGVDLCNIYVGVRTDLREGVGKSWLESVLRCEVESFWMVKGLPRPAFKVKIKKAYFHDAVQSGRENHCLVAVWRTSGRRDLDGGAALGRTSVGHSELSTCTPAPLIKIVAWNCRGFSSGKSYVESLFDDGASIIFLSETWLWPYEVNRLGELGDDFDFWGRADLRLNECSERGRGYGGIGFLWRKTVGASPIAQLDSDRVGGIRVALGKGVGSVLSVIGVYLPCNDQGLDVYKEHLVELEQIVSDSLLLGPVVVVGDFNAHLGSLGGPRGVGDMNVQGVILYELMIRCDLSVASLGSAALGEMYTYSRGECRTTVDYVLVDVKAASMMTSCVTHSEEELNTSDHLPLSIDLECVLRFVADDDKKDGVKINWGRAERSGDIVQYVAEVENRLAPFLNGSYESAEQIDREVTHVAWLLCDAARKTLPGVGGKRKTWYRDEELKLLCAQSKEVKRCWKEAGSPRDGVIYEQKIVLRRAIRKRVRECAAREERRRIQKRERMFYRGAGNRFRLPQQKKGLCSKLVVEGKLVTNSEELVGVWAQHFKTLAESRREENDGLDELEKRVQKLAEISKGNEEYILDVPFSAEEVENAIARLKRRKAAGPDGLTAEHVQKAGSSVKLWLRNILNAVVEMEEVPESLKLGQIVPVYKGGGRDPMRVEV